jgi:hypothetical protein
MSRNVEDLWADPTNWKGAVIYYCKDDPRVIVPKRIRWTGYTLNFAHSHAMLVLIASMAALIAPFGLFLILEPPESYIAAGVSFTALVVALWMICYREAHSED